MAGRPLRATNLCCRVRGGYVQIGIGRSERVEAMIERHFCHCATRPRSRVAATGADVGANMLVSLFTMLRPHSRSSLIMISESGAIERLSSAVPHGPASVIKMERHPHHPIRWSKIVTPIQFLARRRC